MRQLLIKNHNICIARGYGSVQSIHINILVNIDDRIGNGYTFRMRKETDGRTDAIFNSLSLSLSRAYY